MIERTRGSIRARDIEHAGLPSPPGEELFRFATVSDIHIGLDEFGFLPTVRDPLDAADVRPPDRCLRAALAEARAWGAQLLVVKGDITEHATIDEAERAIGILQSAGMPLEILVGNHEAKGEDDVAPVFEAAGLSIIEEATRVHDVPGARLVIFDSTVGRHHVGTYDEHGPEVVDAASTTDLPVIVLTHHHPQPLPIPHHWPPGVPSPQARRFLDRLASANPRALLTTGHTHRHRVRRHRSVLISEVGSTHDYPGTWAGYVVHEGGIRQVVRRIAAPDAIAWTEATGRTVLGIWRRWSPGRISDRCFSHTW